ncbi:hypothetical protein GCM10023225_16570 [Kineococcus glutinatus]|uniref:Uncharacterized protein n=1 Tax=Kineococcus glutinatus TaxID=1070872 RepID=A0ABP9HQS3_9ACTN
MRTPAAVETPWKILSPGLVAALGTVLAGVAVLLTRSLSDVRAAGGAGGAPAGLPLRPGTSPSQRSGRLRGPAPAPAQPPLSPQGLDGASVVS